MSGKRINEIPSREIYSMVVQQSRKNLFVLGVLAAVTYFLAGVWRLGSQVLFWFLTVFAALEAAHIAMTAMSGVYAAREARTQGRTLEGSRWLHAGMILRVAVLAVWIALLFIVYRRIWAAAIST